MSVEDKSWPWTTVVGSYPVPEWLKVVPNQPNLRDAVMAVIATQELAGIDVVTDGELSRFDVNHPETNGMIESFITPLEGVFTDLTREEMEGFRRQEGMGFRTRPAGVVRGKIGEGRLALVEQYAFARPLARNPLKFTCTAPYMLSKTLYDTHYRDLRALNWDISEALKAQISRIDAPVVQIDEANLPGHPEDAAWAHESFNNVLSAITGKRGMHLCFGNYGGQSIQKGFWKDMIPFLNKLDLDHLVLEFARRGYEELETFRDLKPEISLGIGVIDIKDNEVETPELVASRIEHAVKVLGAERVKWVHPDCGFWMLLRSVADRKMRALAAGRDLFLGKA
ncbi:MAG: methionine synthase [Spirochaetaceae bacterium]|nr:MAG: methionine synthase [Spirochaetaceae bacterium]